MSLFVRRSFVARAALVALMLHGEGACTPHTKLRIQPAAESTHSSIRLLDLDDRPIDLWQQPNAAATVVLFTRTDCPISNRFAPEINALYAKYQSRGVAFYLVYVDPNERPADIRTHVREYGYQCSAVRDPKHELVARCGATVTPEAVVFAPDRSIAYVGRISDQYASLGNARPDATKHDLADAIEATVQGKRAATPRTSAIGCTIADLK